MPSTRSNNAADKWTAKGIYILFRRYGGRSRTYSLWRVLWWMLTGESYRKPESETADKEKER